VEDAHILFIHIDIFINLSYISVRKTIPLDMKKEFKKYRISGNMEVKHEEDSCTRFGDGSVLGPVRRM
jgi:hypothetical protein